MEAIENGNGKGELIKALAKATLEFEPITKDGDAQVTTKTGGKYGYGYATLDNIIKATKKGLADNGLNIRHYNEDKEDGKLWLVSELRHVSGCEPDKTESPIEKFTEGSYMSAIQSFGSVITYLKRYHMGELLNLAIDEDDDGKSGDKGKPAQKPVDEKPKEKPNDMPPKPPPPTELYTKFIDAINAIDSIPHLNNWAKAHKSEIDLMSDEKRQNLRDLFEARKQTIIALLQDSKVHTEPSVPESLIPEDAHNPE